MTEDDLDAEMAGAWGRHRMGERRVPGLTSGPPCPGCGKRHAPGQQRCRQGWAEYTTPHPKDKTTPTCPVEEAKND